MVDSGFIVSIFGWFSRSGCEWWLGIWLLFVDKCIETGFGRLGNVRVIGSGFGYSVHGWWVWSLFVD